MRRWAKRSPRRDRRSRRRLPRRTAAAARRAGARVVRLPRLGKGQALTLAEREAPPGSAAARRRRPRRRPRAAARGAGRPRGRRVRRTDRAAVSGSPRGAARRWCRPLSGFGPASRSRASGALSGRRARPASRSRPGFGCEVRMTIDAVRAGLSVEERELPLATGRPGATRRIRPPWPPAAGRRARPAARPRSTTAACACRSSGALVALGGGRAPDAGASGVAAIAAARPRRRSLERPEAWLPRAPRQAAKPPAWPRRSGSRLVALVTTRSLRKAAVVALAANVLNQLDTRPGRALKAFWPPPRSSCAAGAELRTRIAVLLAPYDLREMTMLGDAGANALGAVLGYGSVGNVHGQGSTALRLQRSQASPSRARPARSGS